MVEKRNFRKEFSYIIIKLKIKMKMKMKMRRENKE